jgi:hypothetical protein
MKSMMIGAAVSRIWRRYYRTIYDGLHSLNLVCGVNSLGKWGRVGLGIQWFHLHQTYNILNLSFHAPNERINRYSWRIIILLERSVSNVASRAIFGQ